MLETKNTLLIDIKITEKPKFIEYTINKFNITQKELILADSLLNQFFNK